MDLVEIINFEFFSFELFTFNFSAHRYLIFLIMFKPIENVLGISAIQKYDISRYVIFN